MFNIIRPYEPLGQHVTNPGDNVVELGAKQILHDRDDVIYLIGTPWLWDGCEKSEKYAWLEQQLDAQPSKKFVAVGIGASIPAGQDAGLLYKAETIEACKRIWRRFSAVSVRDKIAFDFLSDIRPVALLPCPSVFFTYLIDKTVIPERRCLFVDAPPHYPQMAAERERVKVPEQCDRFMYQPGNLTEHGLIQMFNWFMRYDTIITARIHVALPCFAMRPTSLVPLDSRAITATRLGVPVYPNAPAQKDLRPEAFHHWQHWLASIA